MDNMREHRGMEIAAKCKIKKVEGGWIVPSQSENGSYRVTIADDGPHCTCPDFELRRQRCKHAYAVEFVMKCETVIETTPEGDVKTTVTETTAMRVAYGQNWPAYNSAQTTEKATFITDLRSACAEGLISHTPHFNSIFNYLELSELTPILQELITRSALPLKAIESDFAITARVSLQHSLSVCGKRKNTAVIDSAWNTTG